MISITTTWRNDNPNTIWNRLARRLGREPTDAEARAELDRIRRGDPEPVVILGDQEGTAT